MPRKITKKNFRLTPFCIIMANVEIKLTENQQKAFDVLLDDYHTAVGYGWWAWWGKTYLWIIWLWRMCNQYPWVRYALVRDTIKNIKQTSVISLEKFYRDYNIPEDMRWKLNNVSNIITFPNGSQILLREWCYLPQDPLYNRFWSLELTWAFVEESAECPLEWIEILQTRVWRFKNEEYGILGKVLETFNPNPWHVYERYYKGKHKDWKQAVFIPSLVYSNNFIDKWYIQNLERASERTKKRLLYGQWDFDDNNWLLFKQWDLDK